MEAKTQIWEVLPFIVMTIMEGCTIALTIFAKTVFTNGMSPFVFIVYTNSLASLILLPLSFPLQPKHTSLPTPFTFTLFMRFLLLGFIGYSGTHTLFHMQFKIQDSIRVYSQTNISVDVFCRISMTQSFSFLGLCYSSPILVYVMGLLIPSFKFLLSLTLRKTELNFRSSAFVFQVMGTVVSIMGACVAELYKGPLIRHTSPQLRHTKQFFVFASVPEFWVLGGAFLAAASFSVSLWNFMQRDTVKLYPEPMKVMSYYSFVGTILSAVISLVVERGLDAWKLQYKSELILIVLTGLFGGVIRPSVQVWLTGVKGPLYVQLFKPFGIAYATTFGLSFFPNSLHYGSVMGAAISGMGYYSVMWGQMKGEEVKRDCDETKEGLERKVPLLQQNLESQV